MKTHVGLALALLTLFSCSGEPTKPPESGPEWIRQPTRTVDAGYIVYVGLGEDQAPERARFKSEAQALEDLANECSIAPKGARVEDHFERTLGILHQTYTKVAVDFQSCEEAKAAVQPEQVRKLANVAVAEQIKKYQDLIGEVPPAAPEPEAQPAAGATSTTRTVVVHDEPSFFFVRSRIAWYKQVIILPPPPGAPAPPPLQQGALPDLTRQLHGYESAHPELKKEQLPWSQARAKHFAPAASAEKRPRRESIREPAPAKHKKRKRKNGYYR